MKIKVDSSQSAVDISLQYYGDVEGIVLLKRDNPQIAITPESFFMQGQYLSILSKPINEFVVSFFRDNNRVPVSRIIKNEGRYKNFNNDFNNDFK
jgi:hypothetical protein